MAVKNALLWQQVTHLICLLVFGWPVSAKVTEVCLSGEFQEQCSDDEIIMVDNALYGRMELGQCVKNNYGHLGCQNDVHFLVDRWCSGSPECRFVVPNDDLTDANENCVEDLALYLHVEYHCVQVAQIDSCPNGSPLLLTDQRGHISSHVTDNTGCGTNTETWTIQARPGQNVQLQLLDFGALSRKQSTLQTACAETLGFVIERSLGVNITICGGSEREGSLYTSKTNSVEVHLLRRHMDQTKTQFLVQYKVIGCSEITPPAHAWYRREGNEAVIGCDSDDREWRLHCNGASWEGIMGNCTPIVHLKAGDDAKVTMPFSTIILLTGVVCAAVLLMIIVVVAGTIYIKKQSINHDMKLRSEYGVATLAHHPAYTLNKNPGYDTNTMKSNMPPNPNCEDSQPLVHVLDRTLSQKSHGPGTGNTLGTNCTCSTLPLSHDQRQEMTLGLHTDLLQ